MRATQLTDFGTDQSPMMTVHSAKIRTKWKSATTAKITRKREALIFAATTILVSTWEHMRQGSFQFGTAQYYRTTPNRNIQDQREGASSIHLTSQGNQLNVTLTSGFNCATAHIEGPTMNSCFLALGASV